MISPDEMASVAAGAADPQTERRVLAAALADPAIRRRLETLRRAAQLARTVAAEA